MKKYAFIIVVGIAVLTTFAFYMHKTISTPGNYFKIGTHKTSNVYLRATPEYEYQLIMEADSIGVYYLGETVVKLPYNSDLGKILLQDNE
jgi:hypothetical protein